MGSHRAGADGANPALVCNNGLAIIRALRIMRSIIFLAFTISTITLGSLPAYAGTVSLPAHPTLRQVVSGAWRTPAYVARDKYRHPLKVLRFVGIRPNMTVIELWPGGGWWTQMLAPYLASRGKLIEAIPPPRHMGMNFQLKLKENPTLYSRVTTVDFSPPHIVHLGRPDSADMVLTFRNLHDWEIAGGLRKAFAAIYRVLKPGGVLGIVAHRALPYANPKKSARLLHRLPEDFVLQLALKTGFRLMDLSEVNKNPNDPLTINVHRLPPDLAWGDTPAQKKKFKKIGESDRMTFKFVKPRSCGDH